MKSLILALGFFFLKLTHSFDFNIMVLSTRFVAAILACSSLVSATYTQSPNATCTTKTQRKAWHKMEDAEKQAYIDAELCLINTPGVLGLDGAQSLFDELQYCHVWQSNVIHYSVRSQNGVGYVVLIGSRDNSCLGIGTLCLRMNFCCKRNVIIQVVNRKYFPVSKFTTFS